jgi:hypothetical protein
MTTDINRKAKKTSPKALWLVNDSVRETVAFCPGCKAIETINISGTGIVPTRRFTQKGANVFHACGSTVPCRLYSLS